MDIVNFTPVDALLGGCLLGLSAGLLYLGNGRLAGVTGVVGRLFFADKGDAAWRVAFLAGLVLGGVALAWFAPERLAFGIERSTVALVVAGILVGFGGRLGNGCTAGHGICGLARFSTRSLVAVVTFMAAAMVTVYVIQTQFAGAL